MFLTLWLLTFLSNVFYCYCMAFYASMRPIEYLEGGNIRSIVALFWCIYVMLTLVTLSAAAGR